MPYRIQARPTIYNGVAFRSRLEAKWAAFFDAMQWSWVYEPFDINGWAPDFALGSNKLLTEVKPFAFDQLNDTKAKMIKAAGRQDLLLLLDAPFTPDWYKDYIAIGHMWDTNYDNDQSEWDLAFVTEGNGLTAYNGGWIDRLTFKDTGSPEKGVVATNAKISTAWAHACNMTQRKY